LYGGENFDIEERLPESRTGPKWFAWWRKQWGKTGLKIGKITTKLGKWRKRAYLYIGKFHL
jgi:hypothetical protein